MFQYIAKFRSKCTKTKIPSILSCYFQTGAYEIQEIQGFAKDLSWGYLSYPTYSVPVVLSGQGSYTERVQWGDKEGAWCTEVCGGDLRLVKWCSCSCHHCSLFHAPPPCVRLTCKIWTRWGGAWSMDLCILHFWWHEHIPSLTLWTRSHGLKGTPEITRSWPPPWPHPTEEANRRRLKGQIYTIL